MASERVAIVTAGGSGMGAGAARKLAEDGFSSALIGFLASDGAGQNLRVDGGVTRHV